MAAAKIRSKWVSGNLIFYDKATGATLAIVGTKGFQTATTQINWSPSACTLQAIIDAITDATSTNVYDILIPAGQGGAYDYTGTLTLKPFVNLIGAGGKDIRTVMSFSAGIKISSSELISGNNRITLKGIRLNNTVITLENLTGSNTLSVFFNDMYMPSHAYVQVCGASYALRSKTNIYFFDSWHQNNSQAQSAFIYCKVYQWGGEFHMMNYVDSDIMFDGTRLKSDQMADVTSANYKTIAYGAGNSCSLIYHNCGEERWGGETGASLYHHAMSNWPGNTHTCQVNGIVKGNGNPTNNVGLEGSARYEIGTVYIDTANGTLYVKTAAAGTDTWTAQT